MERSASFRFFASTALIAGFLCLVPSSCLLRGSGSLVFAVEGGGHSATTVACCDKRFTEVRSQIQRMIENKEIPSMAVSVAKDGQIIWEEAFGWADREKEIPATPHTIYAVGSLSKSITGTGLMLLVERGRIGLDDPVRQYLGGVTFADHLGTVSGIRVRHVVTMTAGIPHLWLGHPANETRPGPSTAQLLERYGSPVSSPGRRFLYSNLSFALAEHIVSEASGRSFQDFMRLEVFSPLGMTRTFVTVDAEHRNLVAKKYDADNQALEVDYDFHPKGGGGLYSSVHDLIRYGCFHLKTPLEGQTRIMTNETIERIHREDDPLAPNFNRYSMGWGTIDDGTYVSLISDGRITGANSMLLLLPESRIAIACVANITGSITMEMAITIADVLVPGYMESTMEYVGFMETTESPEIPFEVTSKLEGDWVGSVWTYEGKIPIMMTLAKSDSARVTIGDQPVAVVEHVRFVDRPDEVVNGVKFYYRILSGYASCTIPAIGRSGSEGYVSFEMRYEDRDLIGSATVIGEGYALPSFVRLSRLE